MWKMFFLKINGGLNPSAMEFIRIGTLAQLRIMQVFTGAVEKSYNLVNLQKS
jgi:hypothetical protein